MPFITDSLSGHPIQARDGLEQGAGVWMFGSIKKRLHIRLFHDLPRYMTTKTLAI